METAGGRGLDSRIDTMASPGLAGLVDSMLSSRASHAICRTHSRDHASKMVLSFIRHNPRERETVAAGGGSSLCLGSSICEVFALTCAKSDT